MTWSVNTINNSGRTVIAPGAGNLYVEGQQAVVTVLGAGLVQMLDVGHQDGGPHYWAVQVSSGSYSQLWWYDGQGACTLTLNGDGSFTLTGQGQQFGAAVGGQMPITLQLPAGAAMYANAFTNAQYTQRITLTTSGGPITQWSGSGEGDSEIADVRFNSPGSAGQVIIASVLMEYSAGGNTWNRSNVSPVGTFSILSYNQRTIVSEDSTDFDWNDSALLLSWWTQPTS